MALAFKKIETEEQFVAWANAVNFATKPAEICDLQDVYGHSTYQDVYRIFNESASNRQLFVFAVNKCQGSSALMEM